MRSWTCAFLILGCWLVVSCQHRLAVPETPFDPKVNYTLPQLKPVNVGDLSPKIPALDFKSLELTEFIPPGATPIWPEPRVHVKMYETPKEKFPSTAESVAPDNMAVVGSRSARGSEEMRHRLRLFRRGDADPTTILETGTAFDTVWSRDSAGLAVSHYIGKNNAEVLVVRVRDAAPHARKVDVRGALERYFPPALLDSARFEIAYRWSEGRMLVVRGIGRLGAEPYDIFGYEVAVDSEYPDDASRMSFLRGYLKEGKVAEKAGGAR